MRKRPLTPADGMAYDLEMMEAQRLYDAWLKEQNTMYRKRRGIKLFAVRSNSLDEEPPDADL